MSSCPSCSDPDPAAEDAPLCRLSGEAVSVAVLVHRTGNGQRLRLVSQRSGRSVLLDATVLDALCAVTPEAATRIVRAAVEEVRPG